MGCNSSKAVDAKAVGQQAPQPTLLEAKESADGVAHESKRIGAAENAEGAAAQQKSSAPMQYVHSGRLAAMRRLSSAAAEESFPGFKPDAVARYYNFPELSGSGQKVAIISLGAKVSMQEFEEAFAKMGLPFPSIRLQDVGEIEADQDSNEETKTETLLDVEVIGGICPKAEITVYRGSQISYDGFAGAVARAVDDGNSVISISLAASENAYVKTDPLNAVLKKAYDAGVTVCCASGDQGSSNNTSGKGLPAPDGRAHCCWPASSPYVLACGGTQVESSKEEIAWNDKEGATGGGVSDVFDLPPWQASAGINITSANPDMRVGRVVPDVAGLASPGDYTILVDGKTIQIGGTSATTPLWAALITLTNEKRASAGKAPIGFVNEHLYKKASEMQSELFQDIVSGDNRPASAAVDYPAYGAGKGFDAVTGWGVPKGLQIAEFLAGI